MPTEPQDGVITVRPISTRRWVLHSTVVLKAAMAVTGLIMVLYLVVHMYGNLKVFSGQAAFDGYARHLRTMGTPLLPHAGALWIIRVVLLASVLIHIGAAGVLWARARRATGGRGSRRYASRRAPRGVQRTYASFTMRWGGVVVALFVVYHLLHLTWNTIHPGGPSESPYERMVNGFGVWWVTVSYAVALLAVGLHLRHGFWSAFATLGANTSVHRRRTLDGAAVSVAVVITAGFLLPPIAILSGWVG
ncbi:succinate dehydrogenase cytochrome b subunit [Pseudonocardia parietis]|uniref:Succinate dehydrogenase / fumarate reductase cytochrome b subunit n=1 Tax=Pseudonocardia parietis TaxID=570936 RepID=A0ABS4VW62_9PSEU|nr:succinate dehydrogenase cytochrome b subunit [Pseudonocardia parietis]MBP2368174.1 succinate dehydrogenase / fumarate reductase cytochrome b subunit [Pseudonocardia parietis]